MPQIQKALGISGIYANASTFYQKGQEGQQGVQIDLVLDRNDNTINLFELKFYAEPYVFTKAQADALRTKRALFKHYTQSRKQIFLSFIAAYGIIENEQSIGLIDNVLTLNALFEFI